MKKLNYLVLATLMTGALATSCSKDDDDKKSDKKILALVNTYGSDKDSVALTYNGDNLMNADTYEMTAGSYKKSYTQEMDYNGSKLINTYSYYWVGTTKKLEDKDSVAYDSKGRLEKEYDFDMDDNGKLQLDPDPKVITYNDANQAIKYVYSSQDYQTLEYDAAGNVVKVVEYYDNQIHKTSTYTYDNKKNPAKGNPGYIGEISYFSTNNPLSYSSGTYNKTYTYEYDGDGYPTKVSLVGVYAGQAPETTTVTKVYYK